MGARQRDWAKRKRIVLLRILGGRCRYCGATELLELDCIVPQGDRHHRVDSSRRMSFYLAQFRQGNLQALCGSCNARKGDRTHDQVAAEPWLLNTMIAREKGCMNEC
jgi:5-methylcytosine-specific restriction endonuclease McrA